MTPRFTLLGALAGELVPFAVNRQQFKHPLQARADRDDGAEWWCLVSRICKRTEKLQQRD